MSLWERSSLLSIFRLHLEVISYDTLSVSLTSLEMIMSTFCGWTWPYFLPLYGWEILIASMCPALCIHSSVLVRLACFLVLVSGTEIKGYPCPLIFRFSLDFFLGTGLLGPKELLYHFSNESPHCSPCWMFLCTWWRTVQESFLVCSPSPALLFVECLTMAVLTNVMWYLTVV